MKIFGRPPRRFLRALAGGAAYGALLRSLRVYRQPLEGFVRYVFLTGDYPVDFAIRTDAGPREVRLYSAADFKTLNEVFCRLDYPCTGRERVIVDIGANIGVASLRFLTRCPEARVIMFEPDPRNVARLRTQLRGFEDRYELHEKAVAPVGGRLSFNTEPSGRLGTLMEPHWHESDLEVIEVDAVGVGEALADVIARYGDVDIVKIDAEGVERDLIRAVPAELRPRIACIYAELEGEDELPGHTFEQRGSIARYRRRDAA
jgi:FkbM family methyltransferase